MRHGIAALCLPLSHIVDSARPLSRIFGILTLTLLIPPSAHAAKKYFGYELPVVVAGRIEGARSIHPGPWGKDQDPDQGIDWPLDVLTQSGDIHRFTRTPRRLGFLQKKVYSGGDAIAHATSMEHCFLITREGRVLKESGPRWETLAEIPGAQALGAHGPVVYVLAGSRQIHRIPGPGQHEILYQSSSDIQSMAVSELGVFFVGQGGIYFIRNGQASRVVQADPSDIAHISMGGTPGGNQHSLDGGFAEGLARFSPRDWLFVVRRSGQLQFLDWNGSLTDHRSSDIGRFTGYDNSGFGYYVWLNKQNALIRSSYTAGRDEQVIRDPDPEAMDVASFNLMHFVLRKNGEIIAANEVYKGNRKPLGDGQHLPLSQILTELGLTLPEFTIFFHPEERNWLWRALSEDLAEDPRPEVKVAREILPKVLQVYDPEQRATFEEHLERYLKVRPLLRQAIESVRTARHDLLADVKDDLEDADRHLSFAANGHAVPQADTIAHQVVQGLVDRLASNPCAGAQKLVKSLTWFLRREGWILFKGDIDKVKAGFRKDVEKGLWTCDGA